MTNAKLRYSSILDPYIFPYSNHPCDNLRPNVGEFCTFCNSSEEHHLQLVLLALLGIHTFASPVPLSNEVEVTKRGARLNELLKTLTGHLPTISEALTEGTATITSFSKLLGALTGAQEPHNEADGTCEE
ncbi:hypothetical protein N7507_007306 [Penicillium longicatenatum]|nr:hypothetical protein N7507_007306 [Penicillium longicatenatum]